MILTSFFKVLKIKDKTINCKNVSKMVYRFASDKVQTPKIGDSCLLVLEIAPH